MKHYDFAPKFRALYDQAVGRYNAGTRTAAGLFSAEENAWLTANGLTPQNLFDYAEDQANYGEPGPDNALAIECVRRNYFVSAQEGRASTTVLDVERMPAKTDSIRGIEWLPRLIPKTKAKLRGELPASLMYCCGGDRKFFKTHDIAPAEFLGLVWRHENNDAAIIDWVARRSASV
jgi:hypothetical protein